MSATEALDAYLERQQSSKRASSSARAVGKPQDTLGAAAKYPPRLSKHSESRSRLGNMAKGPLLKAGAPGAGDRGREGAIRAVWPPSPLDEKDERPLLAKAHPATARTAQRKTSEKATGDQAGALTKLKRLSSSRLRNASGASPRAQAGSEAARPDHFAAALERLRRDQQAEKHTSKQQGQQQSAGQHTLRCAAGEGSQESPGQQRRARWDPMADTEDRLALQRLTQKAAALSGHPSPTKGHRSDVDDKHHAEGARSFASQLRLALPAAPARSDGLRSKEENSAQMQQAEESAQVLNEVLLELRTAEERFEQQQDESAGPASLSQAAHHEAAALGAVTAWYRDVQRKHAAAGLGDDPIIASILPGSSRKLAQREAPPGNEQQAEPTDGSQAGPLLQALLASLPKVPEIPRKAPVKLPSIERASSPEKQNQGYPAVATPPADFAARLSGLAEDMPRLQRDALMQESSQETKPASAVPSPQPATGVPHPSLPMQQGVAEPPAMPVQGTPAMSATTVAPVVLPMAAQRIPSSVGGDLALLQQRWQGYHEPPVPTKLVPAPDSSVPSREGHSHQLTGGAPAPPHQQSMGQQQHSSTGFSELVSEMPAPSHMNVSPSVRAAGDSAQPGLQQHAVPAENRAAPALSPLSAFSPVIGTPVEFYGYSAPPAAPVMAVPVQERSSRSGFSYQAACSPGEHMLGRPRSHADQAPLSQSSIRQLWGHPERKEGGQDHWAAGLGPAWAAQDRAASALLNSQPSGSPVHLSEVELPRHSMASEQMGFSSRIVDSLTEASVSLMATQFDRYRSQSPLSQHHGGSMSVASGRSQGFSSSPSSAPLGTPSSMNHVSNASHGAGVLDALLADALSQEEEERQGTHGLPGGSGGLPSHEQHAGASGRLLLEGDAEAAGSEPELGVSRPGSSRASLVAHYMQRGRAAYQAASGGAVHNHSPVAHQHLN